MSNISCANNIFKYNIVTNTTSSDAIREIHQHNLLSSHANLFPVATKVTRRLVITKQPASEFYKDEGGKWNFLTMEVSLLEFSAEGEVINPTGNNISSFVPIALKVQLYYESGKCVEESDQNIFRFIGDSYDSIIIRSETRKAIINFRLEKVSRRKDGQRFKVCVSVNMEQCATKVDDLLPVFSNAICVLSKRKNIYGNSPTETSSQQILENQQRATKLDLRKIQENIDKQFLSINNRLLNITDLIRHQNEAIQILKKTYDQIVLEKSESDKDDKKSTCITFNEMEKGHDMNNFWDDYDGELHDIKVENVELL